MSKESPTTDESTRVESQRLGLTDTLTANVDLYKDPHFRFGPYIITVDVVKSMNENDHAVHTETSSAWTSTSSKDHIDHRTKKVIAEATGRAVLNMPNASINENDEERSKLKKALEDITDRIQR